MIISISIIDVNRLLINACNHSFKWNNNSNPIKVIIQVNTYQLVPPVEKMRTLLYVKYIISDWHLLSINFTCFCFLSFV